MVAAVNIGAQASLSVHVIPTNAQSFASNNTTLDVLICETNPSDGTCKAPPAPASQIPARTIANNETTFWSAFVGAHGILSNFTPQIPQDAKNFRVVFEFFDANRAVHGSTSTAITTQ